MSGGAAFELGLRTRVHVWFAESTCAFMHRSMQVADSRSYSSCLAWGSSGSLRSLPNSA